MTNCHINIDMYCGRGFSVICRFCVEPCCLCMCMVCECTCMLALACVGRSKDSFPESALAFHVCLETRTLLCLAAVVLRAGEWACGSSCLCFMFFCHCIRVAGAHLCIPFLDGFQECKLRLARQVLLPTKLSP